MDYDVYKAALYTMATCHSLRLIDRELVGDPLDYKMFKFTGWTFEEGGQFSRDLEDSDDSRLWPSIARPPAGMEFDIDGTDVTNKVRQFFVVFAMAKRDSRVHQLSWASSGLSTSFLSFAGPVSS